MIFSKLLPIAGSAAALLAFTAPAQAALMQVGSLPGAALSFTDAPGKVYGAGTPVSYQSAGQTVTFTGVGNTLERDQANNTYLDNNYADGTQLIGTCGFGACSPGGSLLLAFSGPVLGFSVSADDFDTTQSFTFQVTAFNGNAVLGQVTASSLADNGASPAILAATSTLPITSISIADFPSAGGIGDGAFVIGDIKTVPAPEPSSLALLAAGLLGVIGVLKRRSPR